jgi:hypothetical protein
VVLTVQRPISPPSLQSLFFYRSTRLYHQHPPPFTLGPCRTRCRYRPRCHLHSYCILTSTSAEQSGDLVRVFNLGPSSEKYLQSLPTGFRESPNSAPLSSPLEPVSGKLRNSLLHERVTAATLSGSDETQESGWALEEEEYQRESESATMAQTGVNPHAAADLLRQAMAQKYVRSFPLAEHLVFWEQKCGIEWLSVNGGACLDPSLGSEDLCYSC